MAPGRVRQPFDIEALNKYVDQHVAKISTPLTVKQFSFGQSNPTYLLTSPDGSRYVLRKKPPGKLLSKSAHRVEREFQIIAALGQTNVPVPKAEALCVDESVIGTPFYIMEFLDGRIFEDPSLPGVSPGERTSVWKAAAEALAKFHCVDRNSIGLQGFGKSGGFYNRQLATFSQISAVQAKVEDAETGIPVGDIPHVRELRSFFGNEAYQPCDRATLVHGDYKLDNMVFHATEPQVIGILDWEMSTVGHPLSDLANLITVFYTTGIRPGYLGNRGFDPAATPGTPTAETIVHWYEHAVGWAVPDNDMDWAVAFNVFRASAILQGIAARVARRQATSEQAKTYADSFKPLGELAWDMVQRLERGRTAKL